MKRPWTPDHKTPDGTVVFSEKTYPAWKKLCDKAPEMAELLIEVSKMRIGGEVYWEEQIELINQAKKLLEEVGYEPL